MLDEQNANFIEALQDGSGSKGGDVNAESGEPKSKKQRLNVIKLTKWSDLRKWSKGEHFFLMTYPATVVRI